MSTIVGLSTALSKSAVNIIRISGDKSLEIAKKIFHSKDDLTPNGIKYGFIKYDGEIYDEVLVSFMKAPKSFTGEDVIEINCHGGKLITTKIFDLVVSLGARVSDVGEFTKRAFINGKIDLTKAESIIDLINSRSDMELKCAINQKMGKLYNKLLIVKEHILNIISKIEVIIDFENEVEEVHSQDIKKDLEEVINILDDILKYKDQGILIKDGISTCIVGKPNVGKSSLLNYFCKFDRAIVTDIPGTTRDIIEEVVNFRGIVLNLFDTAGIRKSNDIVESIGINMTKEKIEESTLILFLLDGTTELSDEDFKIYELIKDKKFIVIINKCEIDNLFNAEDVCKKFNILSRDNVITLSVKENIGFEDLEKSIKDKFILNDLDSMEDSIILTNLRHVEALANTRMLLHNSLNLLNDSIPLDIISIDIRKALSFIMSITGEDVTESIIDNIFSKFCIGK
ncbi:tRNA uridine-5-carboxymethylaminomethyl(34) synthesis GTPase MnmE [Candidatus Arthromitus sp. SFB-rat-Yit]|uniref:tRNA uridine-5-carboxymethylaminomethyl(34) synthesis GTPase MnmE n=1 Tax=Candidatus Arthromitus sp. SFB-rat-Yit TaxID=1041504 RepID=UPI000227A859|nr:tRNA uridine-5-carboxymethylaminomethyl(34) synthesis GTPase MnmE [Candidatus Arthromitus sp. SFB-rat-Yit]BAK81904.1 tRNA modification GTPase TrmE [Candidatus Arthromitus sp. SFB-rat-Yit]